MILHILHSKPVVPDSDRDIFVFLYIALQKKLLRLLNRCTDQLFERDDNCPVKISRLLRFFQGFFLRTSLMTS